MGDRANVYMKDGDRGVYLYTHWNGTDLPRTLQTALRKKWRWDDAAYLARIIFCHMIEGLEDEECGFGISTHPPDGQDRVLVVDCALETVQDVTFENSRYRPRKPHRVLRTWTFEAFIAEEDPQWAER